MTSFSPRGQHEAARFHDSASSPVLRPDGNIPGVATLNLEVAPKRLQLLHEVVPSAKVVALLVNPADANAEFQTREVRSAAHTLGLELHVLNARTETDFDAVFANITQMQAGGLVIAGDPLFASRSKQLGELTVRHAVPAIYGRHDFTAAGGLLSYGPDQADANRRTRLCGPGSQGRKASRPASSA